MEGVEFVAVWCIIGDIVRISVRSTITTLDLGRYLQEKLKAGGSKVSPGGVSQGGAHLTIAVSDWIKTTSGEIDRLIDDSMLSVFLED